MGVSSPKTENRDPEMGFKTLAAYLACRKIIGDDKLDKKAVTAQKEEEDRMRRLAERAQASLSSGTSHLKSLLTGMIDLKYFGMLFVNPVIRA